MKSKTKAIIFYIINALILVTIHTTFELNTNDDIFFSKIELQNIFGWLNTRYNTWTSRLLIESVLVILLKLPSIVWCILNSLMLILISYSISYLFTKNSFKDKVLSLLILCFYPLTKVSGAGWYATTLNYLWPLGLGLFAMIPIKNALINKKSSNLMNVLYSLALLFACNQEQMCALIIGFYTIFIIYLYTQKKLNNFLIFQWVLAILSIIFILTCPGNASRSLEETLTWYPEFKTFSMSQKGVVGFLSTVSEIILSLESSFIIFIVAIPYLLRKNSILVKINSYIPIIIVFILHNFNWFLSRLKIYDYNIVQFDKSMIAIVILSVFLIISITISLYLIFNKLDNHTKYLMPIIFIAGLLSRLILSFSPTVYASGERTYIFYDFSIIIILIVIFTSFIKKRSINLG